MKAATKNKIKDWFIITRIRLLNFIKEHKIVSAIIGIFLISIVVVFVVRAFDETISSTPVSVSGENRGIVSVTTESEGDDKTIAPNFTNVIYALAYSLGEGDSTCNNIDNTSSYKVDEVVIEAGIPINANIKWIGSDETAISEIKLGDENYNIIDDEKNAKTSILKITIPSVNVCSSHTQTFSLQVLNAEKDTQIKPKIKIKGGSNGTFIDVPDSSSFTQIKTSYTTTKTLKPMVVPGLAKKTADGRDVMFGIVLGVDSDLNTNSISLKNTYLNTSVDVTLIATQGSNKESIDLYTTNTTKYNGDHDGNFYGINNDSRHFFTSGNMPDLTNTSGKITGLNLISASEVTEGITENINTAPVLTLTGDKNVEIEKYPNSSDETYRSAIINKAIYDARISSSGSSITTDESIYDSNGNKLDEADFSLSETGTYEIRYEVSNNNSKTTMIRKVSVVNPSSSNYSLEGAKTLYLELNATNYKELGIYNIAEESLVNKSDYTIRYLNGNTEVSKEDMLKSEGTYTQEYVITDTSETIKRTIVVGTLPSVNSDKISVKTGNIYSGENFSNHNIIVNDGAPVKCDSEASCSVTDSNNNTFIYTINKKDNSNYITEITNTVNIIPKQYRLSISDIIPSVTATKLSDNFYGIGAYYVTAKSIRNISDNFDVNLKAIVGENQDTNKVENQEFASGETTSSVTNKMYVSENSEYVEVTNSSKSNLTGDYFTASMGEDVLLKSTFEYGYDADEDIDELTVKIPVNGNLIPIAYNSEITDKGSSYFGYEIKYNGEKVDEIPGYDIKYYDSADKEIIPEDFNSEEQIVSYIIITIMPNDDKSFTIKPGTSIQLMTKYRVKTFTGTSDVANNLNDLKFNAGATFSWKVSLNGVDQAYTLGADKDTPYVYITPYKVRTIVGIGSEDNYNTNKNVTLDASKNEVYTVFASTDVTSPAMNINSNIFGYNRISKIPVVFELPAGINYVYNKDYVLEPSITHKDGKTILTYNYDSVEPNSWLEPIYFDFNVDVSMTTGNFDIKVSTGDVSGTNFKITNDVSSIDKYKIITKNITIVNVEKVSYGQYIYDDNNTYISNIDKEDSFVFSTKLHSNVGEDISDLNVYTVLPYVGTEKESSFSGTYEIEDLPSTALCTTDEASMVTKSELVGQVTWQSCSDFKKSNNRYSGFTALRITYDNLTANSDVENKFKIYTIGNQPDDVYTFKSYLQYKDSDYKSFEDVNLEVISKKITGVVWEDFNVDGIMDDSEKKISDVALKLYNSSDELIKTTTPDENGRYTFTAVLSGDYYIVADFNTDKYGVTGNPSEDFYDKTRLSVFTAVPITEEEQEIYDVNEINDEDEIEEDNFDEDDDYEDETEETNEPMSIVKTDIITVDSETRVIRNVNLGLSLRKVFGVKVNKYITKAEVTNALGVVTSKDYGKTKLAKLDVKDINNVHIKVVYTLEIENIKYYPGYATLITELIPDGMSFTAEYAENQGWELSEDGTLTNRTLANEIINAGETKYLTVAFDITRKEAGSFVNFASVDELQILGGISDEE